MLSQLLHKASMYATTMRTRLETLTIIEKERFLRELLSDRRYSNCKRLERFGLKVYSQYDEDGIIQEIFCRIGVKSKKFVEFGVGNGLENNTLKLLLQGWSGLWLEGGETLVSQINHKFRDVISENRLLVKQAFIDRDNINGLIAPYLSNEIDLLSIDIDGNDIYILESISVVSPRVIVIEYNGKFPPPMSIAQRYNPHHSWDESDYGGASLQALTKIADRRGYSLVGCGMIGVNAFFVRKDLTEDLFAEPFTAENHYQPARYFLAGTFRSGHPPNFGRYEAI
jgi:hypothetical protein